MLIVSDTHARYVNAANYRNYQSAVRCLCICIGLRGKKKKKKERQKGIFNGERVINACRLKRAFLKGNEKVAWKELLIKQRIYLLVFTWSRYARAYFFYTRVSHLVTRFRLSMKERVEHRFPGKFPWKGIPEIRRLCPAFKFSEEFLTRNFAEARRRRVDVWRVCSLTGARDLSSSSSSFFIKSFLR